MNVSLTIMSAGLMRGMDSEEVSFIAEALDRLAQAETACWSEDSGKTPAPAYWKAKQERAKKIAKLATEFK